MSGQSVTESQDAAKWPSRQQANANEAAHQAFISMLILAAADVRAAHEDHSGARLVNQATAELVNILSQPRVMQAVFNVYDRALTQGQPHLHCCTVCQRPFYLCSLQDCGIAPATRIGCELDQLDHYVNRQPQHLANRSKEVHS